MYGKRTSKENDRGDNACTEANATIFLHQQIVHVEMLRKVIKTYALTIRSATSREIPLATPNLSCAIRTYHSGHTARRFSRVSTVTQSFGNVHIYTFWATMFSLDDGFESDMVDVQVKVS